MKHLLLLFCLITAPIWAQQTKTIHVLVALCDNKYQGIVPVPKGIGNGQDADSNLYWGCGYGVRTYFKRSKEWKFIKSEKPYSDIILERVTFKHATKNYTLIADAYDGKYIKTCTENFLKNAAAGNADLVAYVGHDGLMDFQLNTPYKNTDGKTRDVIILACYSKRFFEPHLQHAKVNPLIWTSGLMAAEAYTLHDALTGYVNGESDEQIRLRAAKAYAKHQKCSEKAARNLFRK